MSEHPEGRRFDDNYLRLVKDVYHGPLGRLLSMTARPGYGTQLHPDYWVEYIEGEWAKGLTPLYVRAIPGNWSASWRYTLEGTSQTNQIWTVEVINLRPARFCMSHVHDADELREFWEQYPERPRLGVFHRGAGLINLSDRNYLADCVKLCSRLA
jgi:hypothetical protein